MENSFNELFTLATKHFLKEYRRTGGSQKRLANDLDITTSYMSTIINGSRNASLSLFEQIAFKLSGKQLDEFLNVGRRIKEGRPPLTTVESESPDSPEELISKLTYYIVDHQRMKKELETEKWLFQEAINIADYGIVIASSDKKVLAYNRAYQEIFGYPEEILATRDMGVYVRYGRNMMANLDKFDREIKEAFVAESPITHFVELKDGRVIRRDVFPLMRQGVLIGRLAHLYDVTSDVNKE